MNACALLGQLVRGALDSFCAALPTGELSGSGAFCVLCPVAAPVRPWPFLSVVGFLEHVNERVSRQGFGTVATVNCSNYQRANDPFSDIDEKN